MGKRTPRQYKPKSNKRNIKVRMTKTTAFGRAARAKGSNKSASKRPSTKPNQGTSTANFTGLPQSQNIPGKSLEEPKDKSTFQKVLEFPFKRSPGVSEDIKGGTPLVGVGPLVGLQGASKVANVAPKVIATGEKAIMSLESLLVEYSNIGKATELGTTVGRNTKIVKKVLTLGKKLYPKKPSDWLKIWAGSVIIGLWGKAESLEGTAFPMGKFALPEAIRTNNFTKVNEAIEVQESLMETSTGEWIALFSPISGIIGPIKKWVGSFQGAKTQIAAIRGIEEQTNNGETENEYYERVKKEKEADRIRIRNETDETIKRRAREKIERQADADALFDKRTDDRVIADRKRLEEKWAAEDKRYKKIFEDSIRRDAKSRELEAEFWISYWETVNEIKNKEVENYKPFEPRSKLNFGII